MHQLLRIINLDIEQWSYKCLICKKKNQWGPLAVVLLLHPSFPAFPVRPIIEDWFWCVKLEAQHGIYAQESQIHLNMQNCNLSFFHGSNSALIQDGICASLFWINVYSSLLTKWFCVCDWFLAICRCKKPFDCTSDLISHLHDIHSSDPYCENCFKFFSANFCLKKWVHFHILWFDAEQLGGRGCP